MKLYAKIKAHKKQSGKNILVEKGQGTNEYMSILLNDENGRNLIEIYSEIRENEIFTSVNDYNTGDKTIFSHELPRGEKKKDELRTQQYICKNCGRVAVDWEGNTKETCPRCEQE